MVGRLQLCAFLEQALHSLDMPPLCSHMPGRVALIVSHIQAAPLLAVWRQQELDCIARSTCSIMVLISDCASECCTLTGAFSTYCQGLCLLSSPAALTDLSD